MIDIMDASRSLCSNSNLAQGEPSPAQTSRINLHINHHTPATLNQKRSPNPSGKLNNILIKAPCTSCINNPLTSLPPSLWREKRDADIARREEAASTKKTERIQKAQRDIDDFYDNYNAKKEKSIARTRNEAKEFLDNREDTSAGGTSWERVAKLVDLSGKGAKGGAAGGGKEKFRELLLDLRKDEKAPGASGY